MSSDTESADVKATSTATTATTAAVSELDANAPVNNESATNNADNKKSKRLPSFAAIFKRMNERDTSNKRKNYEQEVNNEGEGLTPTNTTTAAGTITEANEQLATDGNTNINTDGNDNQPKLFF
ncbi:hypothetical protein CVS40_4149 [Lucilia cuprina]|nr:hypothetical protein CVS40_4149 [Lucilia cuprina]